MTADPSSGGQATTRAIVRELLSKRGIDPTTTTVDRWLVVAEKLSKVKAQLHDAHLCGLMPDELRQLAWQQAQWEATAYRTASEIMAEARTVAATLTEERLQAAAQKAAAIEESARRRADEIIIAARMRAEDEKLCAQQDAQLMLNRQARGRYCDSPRNGLAGRQPADCTSEAGRNSSISRDEIDQIRIISWPHVVSRFIGDFEPGVAVHLAGKTFALAERNLHLYESSGLSFHDWVLHIADTVHRRYFDNINPQRPALKAEIFLT